MLARAVAFATTQQVPISLPNVTLKPAPTPANNEKWLEATILPAPTFARGVAYASSNQHYGLLQISLFWCLAQGELKPKIFAGLIADHFKRGTIMDQAGYRVTIYDVPRIAEGRKDEDLWWQVPITIPFKCFAPST